MIEVESSEFKPFVLEIEGEGFGKPETILIVCRGCDMVLGRWEGQVRMNDVVGTAADHECSGSEKKGN